MPKQILSVLVILGAFLLPLKPAAPQAVTVKKEADQTEPTQNEATQEKVILFIGDSLTEGYGVKKDEAYPQLAGQILNERFKARGLKVKIINGGISGSVTADADRRLKWFLRSKPDVLVLALGANDGLKGTPPEVIKKNLAKAIDLAQANRIAVLLCGIRVFTNFGADYSRQFEQVFKDLAKEKKVELLPFLLEEVALKKDLNQPDQKHPNAKGHEVVARTVAKELEKMLEKKP